MVLLFSSLIWIYWFLCCITFQSFFRISFVGRGQSIIILKKKIPKRIIAPRLDPVTTNLMTFGLTLTTEKTRKTTSRCTSIYILSVFVSNA